MNPAIIRNPLVPLVARIPGGVKVGSNIIVDGSVPNWPSEQFSISLVYGYLDDLEQVQKADIAFHFKVRLDEQVVMATQKSWGQWCPEAQKCGHMPFRQGSDFRVRITVKVDHFSVTVNGDHFTTFGHRLFFQVPEHICGTLYVDGHVEVTRVEFDQSECWGLTHWTPGFNDWAVQIVPEETVKKTKWYRKWF
ncbi:Galectin-4 [Halotydeus destructor]|nr:Galectin-4 [Halotydeus destructor]